MTSPASAQRTLNVALDERSYPIHIGTGLLGKADTLAPYLAGQQVMVVTNETIAPLYLEMLCASLPAHLEVRTVVLPDGEQYKTIEQVSRIWDALLEAGFNRRCTLIALGGIFLLMMHESFAMPAGTRIELGLMFAVLGILAASAANVMQASDTARKRPMLLLLAWAMLWGTLFDVTFAWAVAGPPVFPAEPRYWAGVAYLGIVGSVVTFPLYFKLIRDLGPGRAAYNGVMVPVVAMALSTLFEGYIWSGLAIAGSVLAMIGLLVALRGRQID